MRKEEVEKSYKDAKKSDQEKRMYIYPKKN